VLENSPPGTESAALQETGARHGISERLSQLIHQIEACVSAEMDEAVAAAGQKARRALSEELNQAMRRLRQSRSTEEVATWLVDSTGSFCGQAALFEVMAKQVRGVRARGFTIASTRGFEEFEAPLEEAPALAHSVQERETVIAIGSPAEVSARIVETLGHAPGARVYLYPIVIQEKAVAILYATAGSRDMVDSAALELLTHAAAAAARILSAEFQPPVSEPRPDASALVRITGVKKRAQTDLRRQAREARARWFARAEVARLRLSHPAEVEKGRMERNIYSALKPEIDAARRSYREDFLAVFPVIADYLHKELVSLAHDDANLLGPEYPGSLV
jgi:hypothetical protein